MHYPPIWSTLIVLLLSSANSRTCRCRIIEHMKGTGEVCNSRTTEAALTIYYICIHIYMDGWMALLIFLCSLVLLLSSRLVSTPKTTSRPCGLWTEPGVRANHTPSLCTTNVWIVNQAGASERNGRLRKTKTTTTNRTVRLARSRATTTTTTTTERKKTHKQPRARYSIGPYGCPSHLPPLTWVRVCCHWHKRSASTTSEQAGG